MVRALPDDEPGRGLGLPRGREDHQELSDMHMVGSGGNPANAWPGWHKKRPPLGGRQFPQSNIWVV